jgi:hypothetical protein
VRGEASVVDSSRVSAGTVDDMNIFGPKHSAERGSAGVVAGMMPAADDFHREAKQVATSILRENAIAQPPVRMNELPRKYGYKVSAQQLPASFSDVLGVLVHRDRLIVVSEQERPEVQNASIARLFALDWLWTTKGASPPHQDVGVGMYLLRNRPLLAQKTPIEWHADILAAYLLVPPFFLSEYRPFASIPSLVELFIVPEEFLSWRLSFDRSG